MKIEASAGTGASQALRHAEIAQILGSELIAGRRSPGERMPSEQEFFASFGASRVVMREVYKTLAAKGMITAKARVGTLVRPADAWNWFDTQLLGWRVDVGVDHAFLRQLSELRLAVEPAAAAIAARRGGLEHLGEIDAAITSMVAAGADRGAFVEADICFHVAICAASENPMFRSFANVVAVALRAMFSISAPEEKARFATSIERHALIARAIRAHDPDRAASAMRAVIEEGMSHAIRVGAPRLSSVS